MNDAPSPGGDPVFSAFCAGGLWPGLGRTLAARLAEADITSPADVSVSNLAALPKVGPTRANRLFSSFLAAAPAYEVVALLVPAGLEARLAGRLIDALGPPAPRLIRDDPWVVLLVPGFSPADADRLARATLPGIDRTDPRRARALVGHVLARIAREGHTVASRAEVARALAEFGVGDVPAAIEAAIEAATVVEAGGQVPGDLAAARLAEAEAAISHAVARLTATAEPIDADVRRTSVKTLDEVQRSVIESVLTHGVSVLTGGPGTGKTRTVAALVDILEAAGRTVALAAPTGRAAKRLEELCGSPASTLHRLLGAQARQNADGVSFDGGFARGEEWPLDEDVIIVDEVSMLDVDLAEALFDACSDGTHVLFVGDAAQLPSIGPGRVLGDLIDSGSVPVVELMTLYRQAEGGTIARLATAARAGELLAIDDPSREVVIVAARGSSDAAHRVVQLVTDSIPRALGIPHDQIQVVTPVHRGAAGTQALNAALKAKLNPAPSPGKRRFDPGDRVVATSNHLEAAPFGYANGEVGVVENVEADGTVMVEFASGPSAVKGKALNDLMHGWAITVHRAQGSEFPAVVVVLPPEAGGMLSRPLVYTALTRAQRHLSVVAAAGPAVARAVREVGALPRRTQLQNFLKEDVMGGGAGDGSADGAES